MLTRWNDVGLSDWDRPFAVLNELRRQMDRVFWDFEHAADPGADQPRLGAFETWPRISVRDNGAELLLRAEVPGVSENDLNITVEQGSLTLRGERKLDLPEGYSVHRRERPMAAFARSFTLPSPVDAEKVAAKLKHGVLEMTLPKAAEARPRHIQVRAA